MKITKHSFRLYAPNEPQPSRSGLNRYAVVNNLENNKYCVLCGATDKHKQLDGTIVQTTLQLDHINGNKNDNRFDNRRYICATCHCATPTFAGRNRKNNKG